MGKYMRRKSKATREVSVMDMPSLGGVLTRAKTLALQKAAAAIAVASAGAGSGSYIQLRSRRLIKPTSPKKQKENSSGSVNKIHQEIEVKDGVDLGMDEEKASFGENMLEIEGKERSTRETTPCSLIRDPDAIRTPGSSTKPPCPTDGTCRVQTSMPRRIPSTTEMDEFFTEPERQQQRLFIEKYNFDPVNDNPLPGRYEWVKVDDTKQC